LTSQKVSLIIHFNIDLEIISSRKVRVKKKTDWTNIEKIKWAVDSLSAYKAPGEDGIFPALLQKAGEPALGYLSNMFFHSLRLRYIPKTWRGTFVTFIPKVGKASYDRAKSYRPISLMSFVLKTLEKIMDKKIREVDLIQFPIHKSQHAYQKGKSCETALHELVSQIEENLENKDFTLLTFIDIEGAFDNTAYNIIEKSLKGKKVDGWTTEWINAMLNSRKLRASMKGSNISYNPKKGCPQGGCLSPLLWSVVVDSLIRKLRENGFLVFAYADDLAIMTRGKFSLTVCEKMNQALRIVQEWCLETGLNVNPTKSSVMKFTKGRTTEVKEIVLFNKVIPFENLTKHLGVYIDENLNWNAHISNAVEKGRRTLWATKTMVNKKWGLKPKQCLWVFQQIIIPRIAYGAIVWWHRALIGTNEKKLISIQRQALLMITGAMRTAPTMALEALLNILPITVLIHKLALKACLRLDRMDMWQLNMFHNKEHRKIVATLRKLKREEEYDQCNVIWNSNKRYKTSINELPHWSYGLHITRNPQNLG
jgi:hypothetical protein